MTAQRPCLDCGRVGGASRCDQCRRSRTRARGTRQQRGYGRTGSVSVVRCSTGMGIAAGGAVGQLPPSTMSCRWPTVSGWISPISSPLACGATALVVARRDDPGGGRHRCGSQRSGRGPYLSSLRSPTVRQPIFRGLLMPAPKKPVERRQRTDSPSLAASNAPSAPPRPAPLGEGDLFGAPFQLTHDQRAFLDRLLVHDRGGKLVVRRAVLGPRRAMGRPSSPPDSGCCSCAARWRRRHRTFPSAQPVSSRLTCCSAPPAQWPPKDRWRRSSRCTTPKS